MFLPILNRFKVKLSACKGFTLVELLVSVAIISTLSTIGIASFVSYSHSQTLNTATLDVVNMLETARSRALTQIKPPTCTQPLEGYTVALGDSVIGANKYQLNVRCGGDYQVNIDKLPNGINFSSGTAPLTLRFLLLGNGVVEVTAAGLESLPIDGKTIALTGLGGDKTITVFSDGRIISN